MFNYVGPQLRGHVHRTDIQGLSLVVVGPLHVFAVVGRGDDQGSEVERPMSVQVSDTVDVETGQPFSKINVAFSVGFFHVGRCVSKAIPMDLRPTRKLSNGASQIGAFITPSLSRNRV